PTRRPSDLLPSRVPSSRRKRPSPLPPSVSTASSPSQGSTEMPESLLDLTAYGLAREIDARDVAASEAAEVANARVDEVEDEINALVTITPGLALERAEAVDARN